MGFRPDSSQGRQPFGSASALKPFVFSSAPARVLFGFGTLERLPKELERLGLERALLLTTARQEARAQALARQIGTRVAGVFAGAVMHIPVEVTQLALAQVAAIGADGVVALGGGSVIGLAKAIALRTDLPQVVVPTTYAGSEMTAILGETADGVKTTLRSPRVLPEAVIYDVDVTMSLPIAVSAVSGMNAIAHAVEALYAKDTNPIVQLMAVEGIAAMARVLPRIVAKPQDREARSDALYAAFLCGWCLGSAAMGLHHKLCHTLGGTFGLPHAETHAVMLPHVVAYNAAAAPDAMTKLAAALGVVDPAQGLFELARRVGAPRSLRELGLQKDKLEEAAALACSNPYWNPKTLDFAGIRKLLGEAWDGRGPG